MELLVSCGWLAVVAGLIYRAFRQRELLQAIEPKFAPPRENAPAVAVVVPARDEADNIGTCLNCLINQDYPAERLAILVVDDHSSDDTAAIVARMARVHPPIAPQIALLASPPLPAGWVGKSHACWVGARALTRATEWLCFLDADVKAGPALVSSAVQAASAGQIDLLSLAPRHELRSFAERLMLPCGLFLLAFCQDLKRKQRRAGSDEVTATGQFMLVRRGAYEAVGGHAAIRAEICEDLELARTLKRSGFNVVLRSGERLVSTRMYTGWRTLWPGLAKNLVDTFGGPVATIATASVAVVLAWSSLIIPAIAADACASSVAGACAATALGGLGTAAIVALHVAGAAYFKIPLWYGLLFPAGYTVGALIAIDSVRRRLVGRVSWKGRTYSPPASSKTSMLGNSVPRGRNLN